MNEDGTHLVVRPWLGARLHRPPAQRGIGHEGDLLSGPTAPQAAPQRAAALLVGQQPGRMARVVALAELA